MKLVFYGVGNIAQAIFTGTINSSNLDVNDIYLTNKSNEQALRAFAEKLGINCSYDDATLLRDADYVFLDTKPHGLDTLAARIKPHIIKDNCSISTMVDTPIDRIRQQLECQNLVARIMPNINAQVGHSVTGTSFSNDFDPKSKDEINDLVKVFGSVIEVSEDHLHQVTVITRNGPAFLYHVFEQHVKTSTKLGLEKEQAEESIRSLIIGTSKMIERSDLSMVQLRKNITSKGDTTQAGLDTLPQHDLVSILKDCPDAAVDRGIKLSSIEDQ